MIRRVVIAGLILSPSAMAAANSIAGPVTFTVGLLGVGVAGPALMLGGRIKGVARSLIKLALAIALILLAANILSNLYPRPGRASYDRTAPELPAIAFELGDNR